MERTLYFFFEKKLKKKNYPERNKQIIGRPQHEPFKDVK